MPGQRFRIVLLVLALLAALGVLAFRDRILPPDRIAMSDRPCPPRAADEPFGPVPRDLAGLCFYRAENERLLAGPTRPQAVFIGDSITEYWREGDPALFGARIANRGITGQTSQQLLLRFRQDVIALAPQVVQIEVGINDIAANTGINRPQDLIDNVETMIELAEAHGIAVIVAGVFPAETIPTRQDISGVGPRIRQLDARLRELAARRGAVFADYHAALAGPDGAPRPGLTHDGLHLSDAGYAAIRPVAERALAEALARREKRPIPLP